MTTLSGLPRAAWLAAWQFSLHPTLSCHSQSVVLSNNYARKCRLQGGRRGDSSSDRKRQSAKRPQEKWTRRHKSSQKTAGWRNMGKTPLKKQKISKNIFSMIIILTKAEWNINTSNSLHVTARKRLNAKEDHSAVFAKAPEWIMKGEGEGPPNLLTQTSSLSPTLILLSHTPTHHFTYRTHKEQSLCFKKTQTSDHRKLKLHMISSLHTSCPLWGEKVEPSVKKQNTGWLYVMRSFFLWIVIDSFLKWTRRWVDVL